MAAPLLALVRSADDFVERSVAAGRRFVLHRDTHVSCDLVTSLWDPGAGLEKDAALESAA